MKRFARSIVVAILSWQVRSLQSRNNFKVVAVAGSVGKTSAKYAVANVLQQKLRVRWQAGNYNDLVTVPLIFFGEPEPSLFNPLAWLAVFWRNQRQLGRTYPFDVVVVEVGTDYPGNLIKFGQFIYADISVVTAVSPEHMQFFADLDEVASEELSVGTFSKELVVNADLVAEQYLNLPLPTTRFGTRQADYNIKEAKFAGDQGHFEIHKNGQPWLLAQMSAVAVSEVYSATAAAVVADKIGLSSVEIKQGIAQLKPVQGRMQRLKGIKNSVILDETYNASPDAVKAALDSLYEFQAKGQKIAILGNMNELGEVSASAHREVGEYCDPLQLNLVVTIGPDANGYLAPAAEEQGCHVVCFDDPYAAGKYLSDFIKPDAVILAKGSQNNVYAEEAVKPLLANPEDATKLVRQSAAWQKKKQKNFKKGKQ